MRNLSVIYRALTITSVVLLTVGCGSSGNEPEVECNNDDEQVISCGFKDHGNQKQQCVDYQWVNVGRCEDPTVCLGNETRTGVESCGYNDRGALREQCDAGQWKPVDQVDGHACVTDGDPQSCACIDPDECVDDDEKEGSCGLDDSGDQLYRCVDGQWTEHDACHGAYECVAPDEKDVEGACGRNERGTQRFVCTEAGIWEPTTCDDGDVCEDGRFEEGTCPTVDEDGRNQVRRRECVVITDENEKEKAVWSDWAPCEDSGECVEGSTEIIACGSTGDQGSPSGEEHRVCEGGEWLSDGCWQQAQFIYEAPYGFLLGTSNKELFAVGDNQHRSAGTSSLPAGPIVFPARTEAVDPEGNRQRFSASESHRCAITNQGNVECWGSNSHGQLGDDAPIHGTAATPVWVRGLLEGKWAQAIRVGKGFSCALVTPTKELSNSGGEVYCWGDNRRQQLGRDDEDEWSAIPKKVLGLDGVRAIGAGEAHVCAVKDNAVYCWGANDVHQASDSDDDTIASPTLHETLSEDPGISQVPPFNGRNCPPELLKSEVIALTVGRNHTLVSWKTRWREQSGHSVILGTCGLQRDRRKNLNVVGVGSNSHGQLAHTLDEIAVKDARVMLHEQLKSSRPIISPKPKDGQFVPRAMGDVSCVFREVNGEITFRRCTGDNSQGQLDEDAGDRIITLTDIPTDLADGEEISELAIGYDSLCVLLKTTHRIRCRGGNAYGQLGDGTQDSRRESEFMMHSIHADD